MIKPKEEFNWKKALVIGTIALVTPGGFIALGIYGLKKLSESKKEKKNESSI